MAIFQKNGNPTKSMRDCAPQNTRGLLDKKPETKWYFKTSNLIIAFLCLGPFALPLVWLNPRFSNRSKVIISVVVVILSYYLTLSMVSSVKTIQKYYQQIYQADF